MPDPAVPGGGLLLRRDEGVVTVTLDRPDRRNALSRELRERLAALWTELSVELSTELSVELAADDAQGPAGEPAPRCVVITGTGEVFSSGADRDEPAGLGTDPGARPIAFTPDLPCPVVVALNGPCIGGALRFVADADVVIATEGSWLQDPHVSLGVTSGPVAVGLAARASSAVVAPLVLAGARHRMSARQAQQAGLVSEVVPEGQAAARAHQLARDIAAQHPQAVRTTVRLLRAVRDRALPPIRSEAWAAVSQDLAASTHLDTGAP